MRYGESLNFKKVYFPFKKKTVICLHDFRNVFHYDKIQTSSAAMNSKG